MPVFDCRDCGHKVSPSAEICPSCGAKHPATPYAKISLSRESSNDDRFTRDMFMEIFINGVFIERLERGDRKTVTVLAGWNHLKAHFAGGRGDIDITVFVSKDNQIKIKCTPFYTGNYNDTHDNAFNAVEIEAFDQNGKPLNPSLIR